MLVFALILIGFQVVSAGQAPPEIGKIQYKENLVSVTYGETTCNDNGICKFLVTTTERVDIRNNESEIVDTRNDTFSEYKFVEGKEYNPQTKQMQDLDSNKLIEKRDKEVALSVAKYKKEPTITRSWVTKLVDGFMAIFR